MTKKFKLLTLAAAALTLAACASSSDGVDPMAMAMAGDEPTNVKGVCRKLAFDLMDKDNNTFADNPQFKKEKRQAELLYKRYNCAHV